MVNMSPYQLGFGAVANRWQKNAAGLSDASGALPSSAAIGLAVASPNAGLSDGQSLGLDTFDTTNILCQFDSERPFDAAVHFSG